MEDPGRLIQTDHIDYNQFDFGKDQILSDSDGEESFDYPLK